MIIIRRNMRGKRTSREKQRGLDDLGLRLLQELEEDGTQTRAEIGRKLGAAEATIRRRMRYLMDEGALRLCGIPNLAALGFDSVATIGLNVEFERRTQIIESLVNNPRIWYVASCTGRYELLLCAVSRSRGDLATLLEQLTQTPGVLHIETFLNLQVYKNRPWTL